MRKATSVWHQLPPEVAGRALDGVRRSLEELSAAPGATGASAGVAEWSPGQSSTVVHAAIAAPTMTSTSVLREKG